MRIRPLHAWGTAAALLAIALLLAIAVARGGPAEAGVGDRVTATEVVDGKRQPCSPLEIGRLDVRGGCKLHAPRQTMGFTVLTIFGDNALGSCRARFDLFVGGDGQVALDNMTIEAQLTGRDGACGDIQQCRLDSKGPMPWTKKVPLVGRIVEGPEGQLAADIDFCLDTCLGRTQGPTKFTIVPSPGRTWTMRPTSPIGTSGLETSGAWRLRPTGATGLRLGG